MSIRLVNDAGQVYWFTSGNWDRVLAFAARYGWPPNPSLDPDNWDESLPWNEKYETIGGAWLSASESHALADAIRRGVREDPMGVSVANELAQYAEAIREKHPSYDHERSAASLLREWLRFADFAQGRVLRVDQSD